MRSYDLRSSWRNVRNVTFDHIIELFNSYVENPKRATHSRVWSLPTKFAGKVSNQLENEVLFALSITRRVIQRWTTSTDFTWQTCITRMKIRSFAFNKSLNVLWCSVHPWLKCPPLGRQQQTCFRQSFSCSVYTFFCLTPTLIVSMRWYTKLPLCWLGARGKLVLFVQAEKSRYCRPGLISGHNDNRNELYKTEWVLPKCLMFLFYYCHRVCVYLQKHRFKDSSQISPNEAVRKEHIFLLSLS